VECVSCRDFQADSECYNCGLLTSFARGSSSPCECKIGFSRDTSNGGQATNYCSLDISIPCIDAGLFCDTCSNDTGNWFGDCLSCKPGFFRQFDAATCLDFCPTGSIPLPLLNECADPGLGAISSVVFNKLGSLYLGLPFGVFNLVPGYNFGEAAPANTIDRGLYFDGGSGHVNISGIILNTNFCIHGWIYFITFQGQLLEVETETPTTENTDDNIVACTCGESNTDPSSCDLGATYDGNAPETTTSGNLELNKWFDFNLLAKYNDAEGEM